MAYATKKAGMFFARLMSAELRKVGSKESECITLEMECVFESVDGAAVAIDPFTTKVDLWLTDNAWPYTESKLNKLGFNGDFENPKFSDDAYQDGVWITNTIKDGKENWDLFYEKTATVPVESARVAELSARWRASNPPAAAAPPARTVPAAPSVPAAPAAPLGDDGIPF